MKWWDIYIRMYSHDRSDSYWAFCCRTLSTEMLGIAERALQADGQETKVEEFAPATMIRPVPVIKPDPENDD